MKSVISIPLPTQHMIIDSPRCQVYDITLSMQGGVLVRQSDIYTVVGGGGGMKGVPSRH